MFTIFKTGISFKQGGDSLCNILKHFNAKHAALGRKSKDWSARNQSDMSTR